MKITSLALFVSGLYLCIDQAQAQDIFVALTYGTGVGTETIAAPSDPSGWAYSAAAPVAGTYWNTFGDTGLPSTFAASTTYADYTSSSLVNSLDSSLTETLSISLTSSSIAESHADPSNGGSGENTIQPGGVMGSDWRNYENGHGYYMTFTISGLAVSTPYDLYIYGGNSTTGEGAGITLAAGNGGATASTANTTENSNSSYGSLFTVVSGSSTLMAEGTTWTEVVADSDASGNFSFELNGSGNEAYLNGFQLVPGAAPEPSALALAGAGLGLFGLIRSRRLS